MTSTDGFSADWNLTILLCAVEPSGDEIGAALMKSLRLKNSNVTFVGCGGQQMQAEGLKSIFSTSPFSVMGPVDALKALPAAVMGARALATLADERGADAAVLIDSWAFSEMVAKQIKARKVNTKLYKYVAPQVWASRPQRANRLAALFDGVLTLFEFENDWFDQTRIKTQFVGNPIFQKAMEKNYDRTAFRARHQLGTKKLLAVLPGSRMGEVNRLGPSFLEAVERLTETFPDLRIVVPVVPAVKYAVHAMLAQWPGQPILVEADDRYEALMAADAALAASGTVTTELAICRTPMVIAYRVGRFSAMWMRRVLTSPYASLVNIASQRMVIPEFLQEKCIAADMAAALVPLLSGGEARKAQLDDFPAALDILGITAGYAPDAAARAILSWISDK